MTAKQQFFDQVLGGLKERSAYFSRGSIQASADKAGHALKRSTLSVYLNQAAKQGIIHDAGLASCGTGESGPATGCENRASHRGKKFPLFRFRNVWATPKTENRIGGKLWKSIKLTNVNFLKKVTLVN